MLTFAEIIINLPLEKKERTKVIREKYAIKDGSSWKLFCKLCEGSKRSFAKMYTLVRHIEATHIQIDAYECQFCEESFKTQNQRYFHTKRQH